MFQANAIWGVLLSADIWGVYINNVIHISVKTNFAFSLKKRWVKSFKNWSKISHCVVVETKNTKKSWYKRILLKEKYEKRSVQIDFTFTVLLIIVVVLCIIMTFRNEEGRPGINLEVGIFNNSLNHSKPNLMFTFKTILYILIMQLISHVNHSISWPNYETRNLDFIALWAWNSWWENLLF